MKKIVAALALAGALGWQGQALADQGFTQFQLDPIMTPGTAAEWIANNSFQSQTGVTRNLPDWPMRFDHRWSSELPPAASAGAPFGNVSYGMPALDGYPLSTHVQISDGLLRASWQRGDLLDGASSWVRWERPFLLEPNASITLSGLFTIGLPAPYQGDLTSSLALKPQLSYDVAHEAEITLGGTGHYGMDMILAADILNRDPTDLGGFPWQGRQAHAEDFSYNVDSFGHVALTVHNNSDLLMFGNFRIDLYSVAPVPVPASGLVMALGLAVLAFWPRVRRSLLDGGPMPMHA